MEPNDQVIRADKKIINTIIEKSDSIVAISGLFANIGVFGITLRQVNQTAVVRTVNSTSSSTAQAPGAQNINNSKFDLGSGVYIALICFAIFVAYGLWKFRSWGWLITVIFSVICILLVVPDVLNYHAALVSMILLSYVTQPSVRIKYLN